MKLIVISLILVFVFGTNSVYSDSTDQLQSQIDHYKNLASQKAKEINSLEARIEEMDARIKVAELSIQKTEGKIVVTERSGGT